MLWDAADEAAKCNWNFWRSVPARLYSYGISKHCAVRIPLPNGDILAPDSCHHLEVDPVLCDAFGILLTYHTSLGLYSPAVLQFVAEGYTGHSLVAKLKSLPAYEAEFDAFWSRVQDIGQSLGFSAHAASMEMCFSSVPKGRVHLHAFLGHAISWQGWQRDAAKVQIRLSHLLWRGLRPNMQAMRPWGRSRNLSMLAANGLYYVLGDKKGSMYSAGTCRPFEDLSCVCCLRVACSGQVISHGFHVAVAGASLICAGMCIHCIRYAAHMPLLFASLSKMPAVLLSLVHECVFHHFVT